MFTPPPGTPEKGRSLFGLCIACIVLSTVMLVIRVWSRSTLSRNKFGWDDWVCLASWPFVIGLLGIAAAMRRSGFGYHYEDVPPPVFRKALKLTFASHLVYNFAISLVRFSVLLFYRRVFKSTSRLFFWNFWLAGSANLAQLIGLTFSSIFFCWPVRSFWDRALPGSSCHDAFDLQLGSGVTAVVIDIWILLIPMQPLWKLRLSGSKRWLLFGIFLTGYCVVVFTIGRMASVFITGEAFNTDFTWGFITTIYWYVGELTVAFISISLPTAFNLVRRAKTYGMASLLNDRDYALESNSVTWPRTPYTDRTETAFTRDDSVSSGTVKITHSIELEHSTIKGTSDRSLIAPFESELPPQRPRESV